MASESNADGAGCYNCVKFFCVAAFSLSPSLARLCSSYRSNKEPYARIEKFVGQLSDFVWGPPLLILLLGTHIFLTFRLRFIQRYLGKAIKLSVQRSHEGQGDVSQFGALTRCVRDDWARTGQL
jgi:hypothetical protein